MPDQYKRPADSLDISVVIPVYNAENCLRELYARLICSLEDLRRTFEIIMVEDCGSDHSWSIIQELARQDDRLKGLKLSRNFGQHNAITAGLDFSNGNWTIIMDCDLQDKPEDIHLLFQKAREGHDLVIVRSIFRATPWWKRSSSDFFYFIFSKLSGFKQQRGIRPFRIMSRAVLESLQLIREQTRTLGPLMEWAGFPPEYIDVNLEMRSSGSSSYTWSRMLRLAADTILAYSNMPLRISISIGFAMSAFAACFGLYTVTRALLHDIPVPGWTSLITSLYLIGGIILINLGVIGLYIGKIFDESKGRPLYIISAHTC